MKKLLLVLVLHSFVFSHEGHEIPGAIPPAPHGGVISEAKHMHHGSHDHNHHKASKREIFFEGRFKNNQIEVYALELDPKNYKTFIDLDIKKIKDFNIKVLDARKKKEIASTIKKTNEKWIIDISNKRARRLLLNIQGLYDGAKYKATIQVERK